MPASQTITGTVSKINDAGFQIEGRPGQWLAVLQHADPRPPLPEVGQQVRIGLDSKGLVRTIEPAGGAGTPTNGTTAATAPAAPPLGAVLTVRIAALHAAAAFLAPRPEAKAADVLTIAERFEEWVPQSRARDPARPSSLEGRW